ncbi:MAG: hypothetical protein HRT61_10600 [Ekhidna sp.]|nr:hypothetical protein [Ekhidna sp.]
MNIKNVVSVLLLCFSLVAVAQEVGELKDPRDGKTYKIVTVDIELEGGVTIKRTWMAENLNYEVPDSFCYKNEPAYCEAYGKLYTFEAAKAACPDGWHVPTLGEWELLFMTYGGMENAGLALQPGGESGLNLTLAGFGDPGRVFKQIGISGNYWDAEKKSENTSGLVVVQKGSKEVFHSPIGNWHRNSCRCIKDY